MSNIDEISIGVNAAITNIISEMMERVMDKVLLSDPFIPEKHHASKPIYAALVPDEIFKGSHFERRFVTPFGNVWEKLAVVVATEKHGDCKQGELISGAGAYEAFITSVNALGAIYRERIYKEYLGIEPPEHSKPAVLTKE